MDTGLVIAFGTIAGAVMVMFYTGAFGRQDAGALTGASAGPTNDQIISAILASATPQIAPVDLGGSSPILTFAQQAANLTEIDVFARTIWGEARGEGLAGMQAVASVVMNRVASPRFPSTAKAVCLQPAQFSCWNEDDANAPKALAVGASDPAYMTALDIAQRALNGALGDNTGGALFYAVKSMTPYWAKGAIVTAEIGNHRFYTGVA